jgi:DNA mismatch repair protein MutS2
VSLEKEIIEKFLQAMEFPRLLDTLATGCQTPAGKDALKAFRPVVDAAIIEARLAKSRELEKVLLKKGIPPVPEPRYFLRAFENARSRGVTLSARELSSLARFLSDVVRLRQYLSGEEPLPAPFSEWLNRLNALPALRESLQLKFSERGETLDSASGELKSIRDSIKSLRGEVHNFYQTLIQRNDMSEALQDKVITEREGRWVVPVKRDHQSAIPGLIHGMSSSGVTVFVEPNEIVESNNKVKELNLREDEEIRRILREATQEVLQSANEIQQAINAGAEVDAHGVLAFFCSQFDGQYLAPQAQASLALIGGRHPLLSLETGNRFKERVVPLDLEFKDGVLVILVSGPNAGGKTVALKTLGLACAMAQSGLPVLANHASVLPFLRHFDCDLMDGQSLSDHLSSFAAKLKALKRMMDKAGPETLFLLDELGAGTDPREGGTLGLACLEVLREKGAFAMANTHQPLLKLLTQEESGMANAAMLFDEATGKPTYRLVPGVPGQSYAFTLARQLGFDESVLQRAKAHMPQGEADVSELLTKLGKEKYLAETARQEAERARNNAKKLEAELLTAQRQIKDEAKRIKKEAQVEAEGLLKNTRKKVEHLIQGVEKPAAGAAPVRERVNRARREVNRKLHNIAPRAIRKISEVTELTAGDRVLFKPGNCDVKVMAADDEKWEAVILMGNGLKLSCKYSELGRVSKEPPPAPPARPLTPEAVLGTKAVEEKGKLELDLRGKMVDQALPLLDKYLDDAIIVNLPFVRIIHGKGTGALQQAIHKHLPTAHPDVEFSLAEPAQGGAGVTIIRFTKT